MLRSTWVEHRFRAMGTECHIVIGDAPTRLDAWAEREARRLEHSWSRFDPTSDLCALNAAPARDVAIPDLLALAIDRALLAHRQTDGLFDPTLLDALERWGYDRTFNDIDPLTTALHDPGSTIPISDAAPRRATPRSHPLTNVRLDLGSAMLSRSPGLRFDLGGIGKGLAADLIAEGIVDRGAISACVSMGGDIRVAGTPPVTGWPVPVEDPHREGTTAFEWVLRSGAIATSTTRYRRWPVLGGNAHHLIDPATASPTSNGVTAVVVVADETWRAEAFAKAALIAGPDGGIELLDSHQLAGWMYLDDGTVAPARLNSTLASSAI